MEDKRELPTTKLSTAKEPVVETKTEAVEAPAEVEDRRSPLEKKVDNVVDTWVASTYRNSPISRDTKAFNHLRSSVPSLKKALLEEFK